MTKEQYDNLIEHFQYNIAEAEHILETINAKMAEAEESLRRGREDGNWNNYGDAVDKLSNLLREHRCWIGRLNLSRQTLREAEHYKDR